jgi:acyl-homoserine lactone acylase PvdQ
MKTKINRIVIVITIAMIIICTLILYIFIYSRDYNQTSLVNKLGIKDSSKTTIYRDTWGVPHIYAPTIENGLCALGYAQAEDRPTELLLNMLRGMGELSSVEGIQALNSDKIVLLWDLYEGTKKFSDSIDIVVRKHVQAFVNGINYYYQTHTEDVPEWWKDRKVDEFMVYAYSRYFLQSYSFDDGLRDLIRGGINSEIDPMSKFSNEFVIAPNRTMYQAPILVSDLHLSWEGANQFWELRIHAGDLIGSGFTLPGMPYIILGHNENVAWTMTSGGPDCSDVYELTLNTSDGKPTKYLFNNHWIDLKIREYNININGVGKKNFCIYDSHFGHVLAIKKGKGYAVKSSYAQSVNVLAPLKKFNFAQDIYGLIKGLEMLQLFPHNFMAADNKGNIFYQRTGRVPKRPTGYDWSKPVDGTTSKTEWLGIHPVSELLELMNPVQGYMQNCNVPPDAITNDCPLKLEKTLPYIFADHTQSQALGKKSIDGWLNSRGSRVLELLQSDSQMTIEKVMAIVNDIEPYSAQNWVNALIKAGNLYKTEYAGNADYKKAIEEMKTWDFNLSADSKAALKYTCWRMQLMNDIGRDRMNILSDKLNDMLKPLGIEYSGENLTNEELITLLNSFHKAISKLKSDFGTIDKKYGDVFRVGRGNKSWPCEGNMSEFLGLTTIRSVQYGKERADHTRWAQTGQTSTTVVLLTIPIQSWTYVPFGQSSRPESPHFSDQAEKLFSKRKMKPSWWISNELIKNIESSTELKLNY